MAFTTTQILGTTSSAKTLTLTNNQAVQVNAVVLATSGDFAATGCTSAIAPGKTCTISITFTPTALVPATRTGSLFVTMPGVSNSPLTATLSGTASAAVTLSPNPVSFTSTTVGSTSAVRTIKVTNNQAKTLQFAATPFSIQQPGTPASPAWPDFTFSTQTSTPCGASLAPKGQTGSSCTVNLTLKPAIAGRRTGVLVVNDDAAGQPQTAALTGTGTTPVTISPSSIAFSNVSVALTSGLKIITLKNNQAVPLAITGMNIRPVNTYNGQAVATTLPGEFAISSVNTNCGSSIAVGASCTIAVSATPKIAGGRAASLVVTDSATAQPLQVALTAIGINGLTGSPTSIPFPTTQTGTSATAKSVTLVNHESIPVTFSTAITGTNAGDFSQTNNCTNASGKSTITVGASCVVSTLFSPQATGARTGSITFAYPSYPGSTASIAVNLTGTGQTAPLPASVLNVSPGAATAGTAANVVITGTNTHFSANSIVTFSIPGSSASSGIAVSNLTLLPTGQLSATLSIAPSTSTPPGPRNIKVTTKLANGSTETASLTSAFVVSTSSGLSLQGANGTTSIGTAPQGWTGNVDVYASGTHFLQGTTFANFGDGINVNALQVIDPQHVVATIAVSPTANLGWRVVTLVTGGEFAVSGQQGFDVISGAAGIVSVSQTSGTQGTSLTGVVITGTQTHFLQNATQVSFGAGVIVGNTTVTNSTTVTVDLAISSSATPGLRDLTVTTGGETATLPNAFSVVPNSSIAYLSGVSPSSAAQGQTLNVTISGVNTNFDPTTTVTFGSNITQNAPLQIAPTSVTANITVANFATTGMRQGILTWNSNNFPFSFTVTPSSASIMSLSPSAAAQGTTPTLAVGGAATHWAQGTTVAWFTPMPACVVPTVNRTTIADDHTASVDISIPLGGCAGPLTFNMGTGGEIVSAPFTVYPNTPSLTASPSNALPGQVVSVTLTGDHTHFTAGNSASTIVIDGTGITVVPGSINIAAPSLITAKFAIDPAAPVIGHTITVTTPLGGGANEIVTTPFAVTSTPAGLFSITPSNAQAGSTVQVHIVGITTHFAQGTTTLGFGPDITVSNLAIHSQTDLTATAAIDVTAALGWRTAYVNTGTEQVTIGFRVDPPAGSVPSMVSITPSTGQQGQSMSVNLVGLNTHWVPTPPGVVPGTQGTTEAILGAGITVSNIAVQDATHATVNIAISPTAPIGPNSVLLITGSEIVSGTGFSVTPGAAQVVAVTPNIGAQGETLGVWPPAESNVEIVGQGTNWVQGETVAQFDAGVVVDNLPILDPAHALAQITVLSSATVGFHPVTMYTDGETAFMSQAFNVVQATPTLLASTPNAGGQGTTFNVQILARYTHFCAAPFSNSCPQGQTVVSFGNGVTVNSVSVQDSTTATASISIDPLAYIDASAPLGCHNLTVTTGTEQETLQNQLCVGSGAAVITNVNPNASSQSSTLTVSITGQNTHFTAGLTTANFGVGINSGNVTVTSPTQATVAIAVTAAAPNGFHPVTLNTLGESARLNQGFIVATGGSTTPTLNQVSPVSAQQGQTLTVRIIGQYTHFQQGVSTATFGQGITLNSPITVVDNSTIDAQITVDPLAYVGSRNITVTTGGEIVSGNLFSIVAGPAIVRQVTPGSGNQGQEIVLHITGQQTHWAQGFTEFSIAQPIPPDITINYFIVNSPTSAVADITISPTAQLGPRSIYISTGGEVLADSGAVVITGGIPAILSLSPSQALPGTSSLNVQIAGAYTQWSSQATSAPDFGPGITVKNYVVNNFTSITAVIDVGAAAQLGYRNVMVRTGNQALTSSFLVQDPNTIPSPYVSYQFPTTGLQGQTFTINFAGQYTHWDPVSTTIFFASGGITVNSFQVTSPTAARANITIDPAAPLGAHSVELTTNTELETSTFDVQSATTVQTISIVDPGTGMQGTTLDVRVLGLYTVFDNTTTFNFGPGVTVNHTNVLGPTIATVNITINQLAQLGCRDVSVTTAGTPVFGLCISGAGFSVTPSLAAITGVTPNTARQGDALNVTVIGLNTHWDNTTTFNFGSGINITSIKIVDAHTAQVGLSIAPLASVGNYSVVAQTGGELASLTNAFVVQPGTPILLSSGPISGSQQQNLTLTILGQLTQWTQQPPSVSVGVGINVGTPTVTSDTALSVPISISPLAFTGSRDVTVASGAQSLTLFSAFFVTQGPAAVTGVNPTNANQGTTLDVAVTGTNSNFISGVTAANFGSGVTTNSVTVSDSTHATVNITTGAFATTGFRDVILTTGGETATGAQIFTINASTPFIFSVSQGSGAQGATQRVTVNGQFTSFSGSTVFDFGPGISVNSFNATSPTQATVNITISPIAAIGTRNVTATTGTQVAMGQNVFTVSAGPAYISAVNPNSGRQNQNGLQITVSGFATHFTQATPQVDFGPGVSVVGLQVFSDTNLTATVNISPSAPLQTNDVTVTTGGEVATLLAAFTVKQGTPILTTVSGSPVHQGDNNVSVIFTGMFTHFVQGQTTAAFDSGIAVNSVTVTSNTSVTLNVNIAQAASLGLHAVTLTTGSEVVTNGSLLTVTTPSAVVSALSQGSAQQGQSFTLTITGSNTHFLQGASTVTFYSSTYGYGSISTSNVNVSSATSLSAQVDVSTATPIGQYTVTVTTNSENASDGTLFNILAGSPGITLINPNTGNPAQNGLNVEIAGNFLGFVQGVTTANFGSGITVTRVQVNNSNDLIATINISSGATLGPRDVTVTTNSVAATAASAFSVLTCNGTGPTLLYASPMANTTNVPINASISLEFDKPLDRISVSTTNFLLQDASSGYSAIPGSVSLDVTGRIATYAPATPLPVGHLIYVNGNALLDSCGFTSNGAGFFFTASFTSQPIGPTLTATNVEAGDTGVPTNAPIQFQLSEPIDPITATSSLTLTQGGSPVLGTFSFSPDQTIATFTPATNLSANTTYDVTDSASLTDEAGHVLTNPGTFSFTTGSGIVTTGPNIVATNPTTGGTGVGTNAAISVRYDKEINPISLNTSTFYLVDWYTGYIVPTTIGVSPDRLTAILSPDIPLKSQTLYYFRICAKDVVGNYGNTGCYYSYSFTTGAGTNTTPEAVTQISPPNGAAQVPINVQVSAVMSTAVDPLTVANSAIQLMQAGTPVSGSTTLAADGITLTFIPSTNLAPATNYGVTVSGFTDVNGNAVATYTSNFTTDASSTSVTSQPTWVNYAPGSGATNVSTTSPITITFSGQINPATVNTNTFQVYYLQPGCCYQYLAGNYSVTPNTGNPSESDVTFTPLSPYPPNTTINVSGTGMLDYAGNSIQSGGFGFTTGGGTDTSPFVVTAFSPANGATNIGRSAQVVVTFNKSLNRSTISSGSGNRSVQMYNGNTPLNPSVSFSSDFRSIVLSPGVLPDASAITVVLTHQITDLYGNALADFTSQFTTETDNLIASGPHGVEIRPASGAGDVPANSPITLYLSSPIDPTTISNGFHVSQNGVIVAGSATAIANGYAIQFTPSLPFDLGGLVQVFLTNAAMTIDQTPYAANTWQFTVTPDPSLRPPSVVATNPPMNTAAGNPLNTVIQLQFDESLNPGTVNGANIQVTSNCVGGYLTGTPSLDVTGRVVTVPLNVPLSANCYYYVFVTNGLLNTSGLGQNLNLGSFYTGTSNQTSPPTITAVAPPNGSTSVGTNAHIGITFSGPINPILANDTTVQVTAGSAVPVSIFFDPSSQNVTLYPIAPLPANAHVTVTLSGLQDTAGNGIPTKTFSFTTAAGPDTSTGYIVSTSVDNTPTVPINSVITILASKEVDVRSVLSDTSHSYIYDYTANVFLPLSVSLGADQKTISVVPTSALPIGRQLGLYINGLVDLTGFAVQPTNRSFSTQYIASATTPQVLLTNPPNGAIQVPINTILQAQVNEPVRPDHLVGILLLQGGNSVAMNISLDPTFQILTVTPTAPLKPNLTYQLSISGLQDTVGNNQSGTVTAAFTTATGADLNGPTITATSPAGGDTGVSVNATVQAQFSKAINPISLNGTSFRLSRSSDGYLVPATLSLSTDHLTAYLTPKSALQGNTQYQVLISWYASLTDVAGNASASANYTFTTGSGAVTSETIIQVNPPNGATAVPSNTQIVAVASNPVDPLTLANNIFNVVACSGTGSAVTATGTVSLAPDQVTLTFTATGGTLPSAASCGGAVSVTISGFSDVNGNAVSPFTSNFTSAGGSATTGPTLATVNPPNGAGGISVTSAVSASFIGTQIDPLTVNNNSFRVVDDATGTTIAGTYSVAPIGNPPTGSLITFTPSGKYRASGQVDVYVNYWAAMYDYAGNPALGSSASSFTTANVSDTTALQVIGVSPASGSQSVGQNATITLTFNKSVVPTTVTSSAGTNVALYNGSTNLHATVSLSSDNTSVMLNAGLLPIGAKINVVASSAITDISGNQLNPFNSTFTVTSQANGNSPTIVSQRPVNGAGLVPTTATITLFSSNPLNVSTVNGALHVSQNGVAVAGTISTVANGQAIEFTPATALAPGSLIQVFLDQTAADVYGNPSAATYSSQFTIAPDSTVTAPSVVSVSPTFGSQNVPTNASVFTVAYNEPLNPATVSTSTVSLYNSSTGYMTGYTVSLDPTGTIITVNPPSGGLLSNTYYSVFVSSGIQNLAGLASATNGTAVYFLTGTTTDATTPVVTGVIPTNLSSGIGVNARAVVTFNKAMDPLTGTFQLKSGTTALPVEVTVIDTGLTEYVITPYAALLPNTGYTIAVSGVEDSEGNIAPAKTTTFTTGSGPDLTPPVPVATNISASCYWYGFCAAPVPTNVVLYWLFNKPIASNTVNPNTTVYLTDSSGSVVPATTTLSADGMTVTLQPSSPLAANYAYYFAHVTGVSDLSGNVLNPSLNGGSIDLTGNCGFLCGFYFQTGPGPDTTQPSVQLASPANGLTNVPLNALIEARLSKPLAAGSFGGVQLLVGGSVVPATVSFGPDQQTILISPAQLLAQNTTYTVSLSGLTDMVGNELASTYSWSFTTGTSATFNAPVAAFSPISGASNVSRSTSITITYNEPINPVSVNSANYVFLYDNVANVVVPTTYSYSASSTAITITPSVTLAPNNQYTVFGYYVQDLAGNQSSAYVSVFTTGP